MNCYNCRKCGSLSAAPLCPGCRKDQASRSVVYWQGLLAIAEECPGRSPLMVETVQRALKEAQCRLKEFAPDRVV